MGLFISIAKTVFQIIGALICSMNFIFSEVALYLNKLWPCMEYSCHVWAVAHSCYLKLLDKLENWIWKAVVPSLAAALELSTHCWNVANLSLFYSYYFGGSSSELAQLVPFSYFWGKTTCYSDRLHNFSVTKDVYVSSLFPYIARLLHSLPIVFFPLTYDLNGLKCRIKRHFLSQGSFWTDFLYALIFLCFFFM